MPIEVQASDVFNAVPKIDQPGKRLWSFYGPDWEFRNHYGYLHMMGYDDKPTERFRPKLVRYKGKIYPANRIHSAWPGIEIDGETALMQPKMSDIVKMWVAHRADPANKYPELARIADDNGDGAPEVNRAEEIDALIHSVTQMLTDIQYPLQKKRVVWVMDDRVYRSGAEYRVLPKRDWEASPYANVHKYSHDIFPSEAARGSNGCTDCHSFRSAFFYAPVLKHLFDENAKSVVEPQYQRLGFSGVSVALGAWRESVLKRVGLWVPVAVVLLCLFHLVIFGTRRVSVDLGDEEVVRHRPGERLAHALGLVSFVVLALTGCSFLLGNGNPLGDTARTVHEYVGWFFAAAVVAIFFFWLRSGRFAAHDWRWLRYLGGYFGFGGALPAGKFNAGQKIYFWFVVLCGLGLFATGVLMSFRDGVRSWLPLAYTIHDGLAILFVSAVVAHFYLAVVAVPGALRAILEGKVSTRWAQHHHPEWLEEAADHLQGRDEGPQNT
jgi:formate dehydrogenase subunit gamma